MTDEKASELRRLAERATPGPWRQDENTSYVMTYRDVAPLTAAKGRDPSTAAFIAAANPVAVLDLLNERDEAKAAWERLHVEHTNLRLDRDDEVSRLKRWASAGLSAFHGRLCSGVGGAGVTDDARTCHDPKCVAWAKALEGHSPKKTAREQHLEDLADAFAMEVERTAAQRAQPAGCMQVPAHGDFVNATPSVLSRLSWWARAFREALKP